MQKKIETKNNKIYLDGKITKTSFTVLKFELAYNKNGYNKAFKANLKALGLNLSFTIQVYKKRFTSQYCYAERSAR